MEQSRPRVLITGARGFIGRYVVRSLRALPDLELVQDLCLGEVRGIDLLDRPAVRRLVDDGRVSHIVHACGCHPQRAVEDLFLRHVATTQNLLDAFADAGQVVRWINVGSAAQYAAQDAATEPEIDEQHADQALSPYAASKVAQEQLVLAAASRDRVQPIFLRVFNAIGPGQCGPFLIPAIIEQLRDPSVSVMRLGNLGCVRDFVDVRDVAEAVAACVRAPLTSGEKLNVCSGIGTRVDEIARMLAAAAGRGRDMPLIERPMPPPAIVYQRGSYRRIESLCGWRPRYSLAQSLHDIWQAAGIEAGEGSGEAGTGF